MRFRRPTAEQLFLEEHLPVQSGHVGPGAKVTLGRASQHRWSVMSPAYSPGRVACIDAPELIETILTHLAARNTGGINRPRAPPLHAPLTQPPASPSAALS